MCADSSAIVVAIIALLGTIFSVVFTFISNKRNNNEIKRVENLKKENSKELFAHQKSFEIEFTSYVQIWDKLIDVRNAVRVLRPKMDLAFPVGKTQAEVIAERFNDARDKGQIFIDYWEKHRPFYDEAIYQELDKLRRLLLNELLEIKFSTPGAVPPTFWDDGEKTVNEFARLSDNICIAIRKRIGIINDDYR